MLKLMLKFAKKVLLIMIMSAMLISGMFTTTSYADYSENTQRECEVVIRSGEWQNQYEAKKGKRYTWGRDYSLSQHGLTVKDIPSDIPLRCENGEFFISEADINLKTARAIAQKLHQYGVDVDLQYAQNKKEDLNAAGMKAAMKHPKIYLSVHHNSFKETSNGYFFMSNQGDTKSSTFAQRLSESIKENGKVRQNSNRANDGYIGELNIAGRYGRIAVLAELGYFSNPEELKKIMSDEYVDYVSTKLAQEIYYQVINIREGRN